MSLLFIFDMDDVLYDYDWRLRMSAMTEITGLPLDELRRRWWHNDGEWAAEAGGFASAADYLSAFEKAIGMPVDETQFVEARAGAMTVWPESLAAVRRASELGTITLLTNNGPLVSKHLRAIAPQVADHLRKLDFNDTGVAGFNIRGERAKLDDLIAHSSEPAKWQQALVPMFEAIAKAAEAYRGGDFVAEQRAAEALAKYREALWDLKFDALLTD